MILKLFFLVILLSCAVAASVSKYHPITKGTIISFVLLNHARLINEIEFGSGDYVVSLSTQTNVDITSMQKLLMLHSDPYQFAKALIRYK